jgi:hypothetical protein
VLVINNPPCFPTMGKTSGSLRIFCNMYINVMDFVLLLEDRDDNFGKSCLHSVLQGKEVINLLNLKFPVAF